MIVGVLAISPEIVKIIGSKEYWDGTRIIMWVVFATFLNYTYTLYVNIESFHRKTALISSGTVLTAFINVVLNYMFLMKYGYGFAVASTVISYFAMLVFYGLIVNKVMKIKVAENIFLALVVAAIFVITCVTHMFLEMFLIRIALGIVIDAVLAVIIVMMYKRIGKIEL